MFGMSWSEIAIILAVGMFVLGPERIPVAVQWVGSTLRTVRTMAAGAQEQLRGEFGPELEELRRQVADLQSLKEIQELRSLRDLNPRSMISKNLLGDEFSGGISGFLGLDQSAKATGSGVAAPAATDPAVSAPAMFESAAPAPAMFESAAFESAVAGSAVSGSAAPAPAVDLVKSRTAFDLDAT